MVTVTFPLPMPHQQQKMIGLSKGYGLYLQFRLRFSITPTAHLVKRRDFPRIIHHDELDGVTDVPFYPGGLRAGHRPGLVIPDEYVYGKGFYRRERGVPLF
jgi:hypothetical protein